MDYLGGYQSESVYQRSHVHRQRHFYTEEQLVVLESEFDNDAFPNRERRFQIASHLGVPDKSVLWWFQNRRRRIRQQQKPAAAPVNSLVMRTQQRKQRRSQPYQSARDDSQSYNYAALASNLPCMAQNFVPVMMVSEGQQFSPEQYVQNPSPVQYVQQSSLEQYAPQSSPEQYGSSPDQEQLHYAQHPEEPYPQQQDQPQDGCVNNNWYSPINWTDNGSLSFVPQVSEQSEQLSQGPYYGEQPYSNTVDIPFQWTPHQPQTESYTSHDYSYSTNYLSPEEYLYQCNNQC